MADTTLLRTVHNKKKPKTFSRQDSHKKKGVGTRWRKPRGLHSKMRLEKRGYNKIVKVGYKSPVSVRDRDKKGKEISFIKSVSELKNCNKDNQSIIIDGKLGWKKKKTLLDEAVKGGFTILNASDITAFIKRKDKILQERKKERKARLEKRAEKLKKKKEEKPKKEEKKETKDKEEKTEKKEDEKKQEIVSKKEKDKQLTQTQ